MTLDKKISKTLINIGGSFLAAITALSISNSIIGYGITKRGLSQETLQKREEIVERLIKEYPHMSYLEKWLFLGNYQACKSYLNDSGEVE